MGSFIMKNNFFEKIKKSNFLQGIEKFLLGKGMAYGFIAAIIITIISSVSSILYTQNLYNGLKVNENDQMGANYILDARIDLLKIEQNHKNLLICDDTKASAAYLAQINSLKSGILLDLNKADPTFLHKKGREFLEDAKKLSDNYMKDLDHLISLVKMNSIASARRFSLTYVSSNYTQLDSVLNRMDNFKQDRNLQFYKTVIVIYQINLSIMIMILITTLTARVLLFVNRRKKTAV